MKKNYIKPCLLSETFVANNIMSSEPEKNVLSTAVNLYLKGSSVGNVRFTEFNTLNTVNFAEFNK